MKGKAQPGFIHHPDLLKCPLKRKGGRGAGELERVSWDDTPDGIAGRLTEARDRYGSFAIAGIHGTGPWASLCSALIPYMFGSPNRISVDLHICVAPSLLAEHATFGAFVMMEAEPDYGHACCIVVWGENPLASHPVRGQDILQASERMGRS